MRIIDMNIWTNGCFDILHIGHVAMLEYAASLGDTLVVGIDTDSRVKKAKGEARPINCSQDRKKFLEAIRFVDKVVEFETDEELRQHLIDNKIDIMVVGSDWKEKRVIGQEVVKNVEFFDRIGNHSTTRIISGNLRG